MKKYDEAILDYDGIVATRFKKRQDADRIAVVTPERCTACDFCIDVCPFDAISYTRVDEGFFNVASVDPTACKGCDKLCVSVCIKEAIELHPRQEASAEPTVQDGRTFQRWPHRLSCSTRSARRPVAWPSKRA